MSEGIMADKYLVHRRTVLQGAVGLATAGLAGLRPVEEGAVCVAESEEQP